MSARKILLVCVLAAAAFLPLVGCADKADKGGAADSSPASSNTTSE